MYNTHTSSSESVSIGSVGMLAGCRKDPWNIKKNNLPFTNSFCSFFLTWKKGVVTWWRTSINNRHSMLVRKKSPFNLNLFPKKHTIIVVTNLRQEEIINRKVWDGKLFCRPWRWWSFLCVKEETSMTCIHRGDEKPGDGKRRGEERGWKQEIQAQETLEYHKKGGGGD